MLNENQKIWRYLDLWKFESMLEKESLFFAKASEMDDEEEGLTSKTNRSLIIDLIQQNSSLSQDVKQEASRCP
jgi:hypothetical protein